MKKLALCTLIALQMVFSSAQADQAPDFTVSAAEKAGKLHVTVLPPKAHHINVKAPMDLEDRGTQTKFKATAAKEAEVLFVLPDAKPREYRISLYLCDNANTYCEKHQVVSKWSGKSGTHARDKRNKKEASDTMSATKKPAIAKSAVQAHGFILNDPETALAQAKRENKPLLIDFFGIWCPPCNMLDEEVFSNSAFQKAAAKFVRLKLDADSNVSWTLKSRYRVNGYPTIIFAAPDGDEIARFAGFRPLPEFLSAIDKAWESRDKSYARLKESADAGDRAARDKVGLLQLERHDYELAAKYLAGTTAHREDLLAAEIGMAEESEGKLTDKLAQAIKEFPASWDSIDRRMKLADIYEAHKETEKRDAQLREALGVAEGFLKHPEKLSGLDASLADDWQMIASIQESLANGEAARAAWKNAVNEYRRQIARLGKDKIQNERGYNLELAYCLWKANEVETAEALYQSLEKRYSHEFTFYFGHARMDLALKKQAEAAELAQKAFEYSYGDNRLRVAQVLAQVYLEQGKKKDGLDVIHKALNGFALPDDKALRTHRYAQKLKELEGQLSQ